MLLRHACTVLSFALLVACSSGETGPAGKAGSNGAPGEDGTNGEPGEQGPQGAQGAPGEQGAQGATGQDGQQGPQGPQGAGTWVWKDANGVTVPGIVLAETNASALLQDGPVGVLLVTDPNGHIWRLDADDLTVVPAVSPLLVSLGWESSDCTGGAYVARGSGYTPPLPRLTFQLITDGTIRARADSTPRVSVDLCSGDGGNGCQAYGSCQAAYVIAEAGTVTVTEPDMSAYTPPLHPELP